MLQNLHRVYVRSKDFERAVATLDLMIAGAPETAEWYHARGVLLMELERWQAARRDFETYLAHEPGRGGPRTGGPADSLAGADELAGYPAAVLF